MEVVWLCQRHS